MTYANPRSRYCYPVERFADRVVERTNQGALILAYVGHGKEERLDDITLPQPGGAKPIVHPILDVSHVPGVDSAGPPIMVALACLTGRYDGPTPSIGEALLASGKGPVAFLGASRISHP